MPDLLQNLFSGWHTSRQPESKGYCRFTSLHERHVCVMMVGSYQLENYSCFKWT